MKQKSEIKRTGPELLKRLLRQREMSVFLIILLVVAIVAIVNPKFIQPSNMKSIALSVATDGLLSIGLTLALILGGIELSVGGVAAMTCVIAGQMALMGVNIWVACLAALAAGAICGLFNGFMVSKVGLPPFIVTLSMMNLSRGVAYIITTGSPLSVSGYLPDSFRFLATGDVFGIPVLFLIFLLVTVVALYEEAQALPLPQMYGKNLTFKTGGVDGCDCGEILGLIEQGKLDTTPLITHRFPLSEVEEAYRIFENRLDGVIKIAVTAG